MRPRAVRTAKVETPHWLAIASRPRPCASRSLIFAVSSGVSLVGPLGPFLAGSSPASPFSRYAETHRHTVARSVPSAAATCFCVAAFSWVTCTAASRRPASSPASQLKVTMPCTHIWPPPSGKVEQPDARGDLGSVAGQPRQYGLGQPAACHDGPPPDLGYAFILSNPSDTDKGRGQEITSNSQLRVLITIGKRIAMSGALSPGYVRGSPAYSRSRLTNSITCWPETT